MPNLEDLVRQADDLIRADNEAIARSIAASGGRQQIADERQSQAAADLHNFLAQYEESQRQQEIKDLRQEKENKFNKRVAIISLTVAIVSAIFGGASFVISIISFTSLRG